jgi:hypothetical protein
MPKGRSKIHAEIAALKYRLTEETNTMRLCGAAEATIDQHVAERFAEIHRLEGQVEAQRQERLARAKTRKPRDVRVLEKAVADLNAGLLKRTRTRSLKRGLLLERRQDAIHRVLPRLTNALVEPDKAFMSSVMAACHILEENLAWHREYWNRRNTAQKAPSSPASRF